MRTPAVLVTLMVLLYFAQKLLEVLGLHSIAILVSLQVALLILVIATWVYARYSGNGREIGLRIDEGVQWLW